jgi:hypothetical protein
LEQIRAEERQKIEQMKSDGFQAEEELSEIMDTYLP